MVDSSTGNKNAVDTSYGKNTIGTFYQPKFIIIDPQYLKTLPDEQFSNGMAEIIKIAYTSNTRLWKLINSKHISVCDDMEDALLEMIEESIQTKKKNSRM